MPPTVDQRVEYPVESENTTSDPILFESFVEDPSDDDSTLFANLEGEGGFTYEI